MRKTKKTNAVWLDDSQLAAVKMQAIEVAARLPEPEPYGQGMMSGTRPGKSADKVISDAEKIIAFVIKR